MNRLSAKQFAFIQNNKGTTFIRLISISFSARGDSGGGRVGRAGAKAAAAITAQTPENVKVIYKISGRGNCVCVMTVH